MLFQHIVLHRPPLLLNFVAAHDIQAGWLLTCLVRTDVDASQLLCLLPMTENERDAKVRVSAF